MTMLKLEIANNVVDRLVETYVGATVNAEMLFEIQNKLDRALHPLMLRCNVDVDRSTSELVITLHDRKETPNDRRNLL